MKFVYGLAIGMALAASSAQAASVERGKASWYGREWDGRLTASGKPFNHNALTAAHRTLPLGTKVLVKDTKTGRTVKVTITDRGPYVPRDPRIIDLSEAAAKKVGLIEGCHIRLCEPGVKVVTVRVLSRPFIVANR